MKKRILSILLALFLLIGLGACDLEQFGPKESNKPSKSITVTENEPNYYLPILTGYRNIRIDLAKNVEVSLLDGLFALDYKGIDITNEITFDDSNVNYNKVGRYVVTYQVIDSKGGVQSAQIEVEIYDSSDIRDLSLSIYQLNDFHGALLFNDSGARVEMGLANIANLIEDERKTKDVLLVTAGDILQGQAISNFYKGASIIHVMNEMEFDAFVIGNHEFDWGLDTLLSYFNGENELQANFPLLGANVFRKDNDEIPFGIEEYTIVEKNGIDVGVIGVIGEGLESSIDGSLVRDYYFADPVPIIARLVNELRNEKNVDRVIVVAHDGGTRQEPINRFNREVAKLNVDAIINGHSHQEYTARENGVPIIQSGSSGNYLGNIELTKTGSTIQNISYWDDARLRTPNEHIKEIVDFYEEGIYDQLHNPILLSNRYYSRDDLTNYIAKLMRVSTDSDIGFHNYGGTRVDISSGDHLTEGKILQILPFDNMIITMYLWGSSINQFLNSYDGANYDKKPGVTFESNKRYKVAVHSFIFFRNEYYFFEAEGVEYLDSSIYQLFVSSAKAQRDAGYTYFNINNDVIFEEEFYNQEVFYNALTYFSVI